MAGSRIIGASGLSQTLGHKAAVAQNLSKSFFIRSPRAGIMPTLFRLQ